MFLVRPKECSALFLSVRLLQIHAANSMFVGIITVPQKSVFLYQCFEVLSLAKMLDYKMVVFAANSKGNTGNLRCVPDQDHFALYCRSFCVWFFRDNACFRERICLQLVFTGFSPWWS